MGIHDSQKGRQLAELAITEDDLLRQLPNTTGEERQSILNQLAVVDSNRVTTLALTDHTYWCNFHLGNFTSPARLILGLKFILDHDEDALPTKTTFNGNILIMCPTCKATIQPVQAAMEEHD